MELARKLKPSHLRLLIKITEVEKLHIAAHALAMSQPAASRILSDIESAAGGKLFVRHPWGMEPTELGRVFMRHARVILSEFDSLDADMRSISLGESGVVRVGSVTGPAVECLVPAVQKLKCGAPAIQISIEIAPSMQLMRGLEEGRFDFIIARAPDGHNSTDLQLHPARSETVSFLVKKDHPFAAKPCSLGDLIDYEWVMQEPGTPIRQAVEDAFYKLGLSGPINVTNSSSLLIALSMLERGSVIAPLSQQVAELLTKGGIGANLVELETDATILVRPYFVIRNRYRQPTRAAERLLMETLRRL